MAIQPGNGKIVVAGESVDEVAGLARFAVARYTPDGALDASFGGGDGLLTTNVGGIAAGVRYLALQTDGTIVVVGEGDEGQGIALIDARHGALLTILPSTHHNPWLAFSADGDPFACGDRDRGASIWRLQSVRDNLATIDVDW